MESNSLLDIKMYMFIMLLDNTDFTLDEEQEAK